MRRRRAARATGVTVVVPPELPTRAGVDTTNGVGELTAKLEIDEYGLMITPVWLCGTHAVGTVYHGAVLAAGGSPKKTVIPVVGECDDSDLADSRTVTVEDGTRRSRTRGRTSPKARSAPARG